MKKRTLDLVIIAAIFLCLIYTALTGMLMHSLHVPMIIFHDHAGYLAVILSIVHAVRKRDRLKAYFKLPIEK